MRPIFIPFILFSVHVFAEYVEEFVKNPVENYKALLERRERQGNHFKFPELKDTIDVLKSHVENEIKSLPESLSDINLMAGRHGLNICLDKIKKLEKHGYPYAISIINIQQCLDNLESYYYGKGSYKEYHNGISHDDDFNANLLRLLKNPKIILIPTISQLSFRFFADIQSVRVYPLGISLSPTIEGDGRIMTPTSFFSYDVDHAEFMDQAFVAMPGTDGDKMDKFQGNMVLVLNEIDKIFDPLLKEACELMLFSSFHEGFCPIRCDFPMLRSHIVDNYQDVGMPVKLGNLAKRIKRQLKEGFFGEDKKVLMPFMHSAKQKLLEIIDASAD